MTHCCSPRICQGKPTFRGDINIGTGIRQDYERALKEKKDNLEHAKESVRAGIAGLIQNYFGIVGSAKLLKSSLRRVQG